MSTFEASYLPDSGAPLRRDGGWNGTGPRGPSRGPGMVVPAGSRAAGPAEARPGHAGRVGAAGRLRLVAAGGLLELVLHQLLHRLQLRLDGRGPDERLPVPGQPVELL